MKPIAWVKKNLIENLSKPFFSQVTFSTGVKANQIGDFNIPLYDQESIDAAFENGRQLGMKQEKAMWELAHSTQEIMK